MVKTIKNNWQLIIILVIGLFLRTYKPLELFNYSHDQDLLGWFMRDVLFNHHLRLIGQETSSHGIFIGPFYYYLQIPFYLLTRLDPAGTVFLSIILGVITIFSFYYVLKQIFNRNVGLIAALIYSFSTLIVFTDREVDPTMPVMLWSIWYLYSLWLVLNGKKYAYLILGILIGFIWSINLQFIILLPLILLAQIFSKKKINLKELLIGVLVTVILNIPFVAFEVRHGFQQTKAILLSLTSSKDYVAGTATGLAKLDRVMQLVYKNTTHIFWTDTINIPVTITFWSLVAIFIFLIYKKKISGQMGVLLLLWQALYIIFFATNSINTSEYYLNGMNVVWIMIISLVLGLLIEMKKIKFVGIIAIVFFALININTYSNKPVDASGYVERKEIITYIKKDADQHGFPCVSLSFITSPGRDLGYRYFTWELSLKTKKISDKVPVYSIVFPHSLVDKLDKTFGALGLVMPDYKRYNNKIIDESCKGDDYTVTQPMFGFTD